MIALLDQVDRAATSIALPRRARVLTRLHAVSWRLRRAENGRSARAPDQALLREAYRDLRGVERLLRDDGTLAAHRALERAFDRADVTLGELAGVFG